MTAEKNSRDNSVFIKESRTAHAENMKNIIFSGVIITILTVFVIFAVLPYISIKFILMCAGAAVCVISMAVNAVIEIFRFRRFTEFIYGMDENEFYGLNAQAVGSGSDFDMLYMLDEYLYLCPRHVLIPYYGIKETHLITHGVLSKRSGADFYVYCHSGKKYTVHLDGNYFKYSGGEDAFKAMLNLKISKSHNL